MHAYIVRARVTRDSARADSGFAISIAVFDSPEEAISAAKIAFPEWSEFSVIGEAPDSVAERRGFAKGMIKRIAWRS